MTGRLVSLVRRSQGRFTLENIFCGLVTNLALATVFTQLTNQINNQSIIPSTEVIQFTSTLKMTTAQVVETSVTINNNTHIQDYFNNSNNNGIYIALIHRCSKHFTFTRTIKLNLLLKWFLGSNCSQSLNFVVPPPIASVMPSSYTSHHHHHTNTVHNWSINVVCHYLFLETCIRLQNCNQARELPAGK